MEDRKKRVEGFRFLPPGLAAWIQSFIPEQNYEGVIPWTPLEKPLSEASFALVTSAGISCKEDEPFDMEREKKDWRWGDPSYRKIPRDTRENDIRVDHLHINTSYIREDMNVMLPIDRFAEFERDEVIGRLAETHYSFYGFQWENDRFLDQAIWPMAEQMSREQVDAVFLTPA